MKKLHIFGLTIIGLVTYAYINVPEFFAVLTQNVAVRISLLISLLLIIAAITVVRLWFKKISIPSVLPNTLGLLLWIISGSLFFFNPEYFYTGVNLPMPFWFRVSFYTLPAIALESSIVTGFEYLLTQLDNYSNREKKLTMFLFSLYTLMTMAINFLAIGEIIPVALHIMISKIVIASSMAILIVTLLRKKHLS